MHKTYCQQVITGI